MNVAELRKAIEGLPDEMPVLIEQACSEGCGVGIEPAEIGVEDQDWRRRSVNMVFVISDGRRRR